MKIAYYKRKSDNLNVFRIDREIISIINNEFGFVISFENEKEMADYLKHLILHDIISREI